MKIRCGVVLKIRCGVLLRGISEIDRIVEFKIEGGTSAVELTS